MGVILAGLRPISTSPFSINSCSPISRGRLDGILWSRYTSINISSEITRGIVSGKTWLISTTYAIYLVRVAGLLMPISTSFTTSTINWGIVAGIKRPMSTTSLYLINFHTLFFRTFITAITTEVKIIAGLTRPISYILIYPKHE